MASRSRTKESSKDARRRQDPIPEFVEPMLAQAVDELPSGPDWGYEPKLDGHRTLILKGGDAVDVRTRNNKRPLVDVRHIATAAARAKADQAIIDGEITALDDNGLPSFEALQHRDKNYRIVFWAFDLLFVDGVDIRSEPLSARQARLAQVLEGAGLGISVAGQLDDVLQVVTGLKLEGIVAKRRSSPYRSGDRSYDWQKKRFNLRQEFVIGGYRPAGRDGIDALLIGVYEGNELKFASKVHGGLHQWNRGNLRRALQPLNVARCPFVDLPTTEGKGRKSSWISGGVSADEMDEMQWVRPKLLAEIEFVNWTFGGLLRHPTYIGMRNDKPAKEVVRET